MLLDAIQEIHVEAMRLHYKVNRLTSDKRDYEHRINLVEDNEQLKKELDDALESAKLVKTEIKIV